MSVEMLVAFWIMFGAFFTVIGFKGMDYVPSERSERGWDDRIVGLLLLTGLVLAPLWFAALVVVMVCMAVVGLYRSVPGRVRDAWRAVLGR